MTDKLAASAYYGDMKETPQFHFVIIAELPEDQKAPFKLWLEGEPQPVIYDNVKIDCAYYWDYSIWYDYYIKGEMAPKN